MWGGRESTVGRICEKVDFSDGTERTKDLWVRTVANRRRKMIDHYDAVNFPRRQRIRAFRCCAPAV